MDPMRFINDLLMMIEKYKKDHKDLPDSLIKLEEFVEEIKQDLETRFPVDVLKLAFETELDAYDQTVHAVDLASEQGTSEDEQIAHKNWHIARTNLIEFVLRLAQPKTPTPYDPTTITIIDSKQEKDPTCVLCDAGEEHEH